LTRSSWLTIPNVITLIRLALVPVFVALHSAGQVEWALFVFAFAALSDGLDGLLARMLDQRSKLGGILDPVADKVLVLAALVSLVAEKRLPVWLLGIILARDSMMIVGAIVVRMKHLEIPTAPTRIGKYATFAMTTLVVLAFASASAYAPPALRAYTAVVGFIAALCVVISTLKYFARFGYLFFAPGRTSSRDAKRRTPA
jgi:cardiolipin synthase (CMP-forming)